MRGCTTCGIHATTVLLAGVPVHVVAPRLGHADPSVRLRVYAHVIRSAEAPTADVFARTIKAGNKAAVSKAVSKKPRRKRGRGPLTWEPPIGIEPMTYALRGARFRSVYPLAAPIARVMARMAPAALGLPGDSVHETVHV